ncbi:GNAT family N-acetyltransferase [Companilactobacillus halodurans]|uniref:GNAT family N-acetyltransferase n=1 Tax=Companilactobacillus halodurans TaxID=2584183 RepID=A0A5P0ZMB1_9LACO|nr:GNAT family N-acetyltransferase [Companilactobacillus halodurans]MQS75363.1 GNAT family N-acetyltransferase [Companilactobacillus halodurans]MQS97307.1 GNAT family N-acetyltransferase [Companilactobacillus halodurans]
MLQIITDRLIIRPFKTADHDQLQTIILDPEIMKYVRYRDTKTSENFTKLFEEHFLKEQQTSFAIEEKATNEVIGFYEFHPENNVGILTYALSKKAWGHGYVAEVGNAMMQYGFEVLNLDKIEAHYANLNPNSGKVMLKMGMRDLGSIETFVSPDDGVEIKVMAYELTKADWLNDNKQQRAV